MLIQNMSVMTTKFLNKQHMQIQGKMTKIKCLLTVHIDFNRI